MRRRVILAGLRGARLAFTVVELLVVIAIIGLLVALLLPAVQAARESARRTNCANNVAQLAKAALAHETTHGFYPSGGWGYFWVGDADRGFGRSQPGGWLYSCLPYLEQTAAWSLPADGDPINIGSAQLAGANQLVRTLLPTVNCPSRRGSQRLAKPADGAFVAWNSDNNGNDNSVARADYAINGGTLISSTAVLPQFKWYVPATDRIEFVKNVVYGSYNYLDWPGYDTSSRASMAKYPDAITFPTANDTLDGIACALSEVCGTDVADGTSMTYLLGERNCDPDQYFTGSSGCDNETWVQGTNNDMLRSGRNPPQQDTPGVSPCGGFLFGSAHAISFCMAFADGATKWIRYDIDPQVHWGLSDRSANHPNSPMIPGNAIR